MDIKMARPKKLLDCKTEGQIKRNDVGPLDCGNGGAKSDWPPRDQDGDPQSVSPAGLQTSNEITVDLEREIVVRLGLEAVIWRC